MISGVVVEVKALETLYFDFGADGAPKPGVYKVAAKGNPAQMLVKLSFADVASRQIKARSSADDARI